MSLLNSKILTVLLSLVSIWVLFSVISVEVNKSVVKKEEAAVENKIIGIKRDNELLERPIEDFRNPSFLEKEARIRLGYKLPGEEVVFVYRDKDSQKASSAEEFSPKDLLKYRKWRYYLLGF